MPKSGPDAEDLNSFPQVFNFDRLVFIDINVDWRLFSLT